MKVLLFIYFCFQISMIIAGIISGLVNFEFSGINASLITTKYIYKNSSMNISTCRFLSFLFNIFLWGYNVGGILAAILFWFTHKGRDGFGIKEEN